MAIFSRKHAKDTAVCFESTETVLYLLTVLSFPLNTALFYGRTVMFSDLCLCLFMCPYSAGRNSFREGCMDSIYWRRRHGPSSDSVHAYKEAPGVGAFWWSFCLGHCVSVSIRQALFSCVAGAVSAVITGYMGRICLCKYVCLMHGGLSRLSALEAVSFSPCHRPLSRATGPEPDSNSSPRCVCFSFSHTPFPIAMRRSAASAAHKHCGVHTSHSSLTQKKKKDT